MTESPEKLKEQNKDEFNKIPEPLVKQIKKMRVTVEQLIGKESPEYQAAIIGDQVGDPMKAAAGPAISILMRMLCMIAIVFGDFFAKYALFNMA